MLTHAQQRYLETIAEDRVVTIRSWSSELETTAQKIVTTIQVAVPDLTVVELGASALRISGQGDIDIYVLCSSDHFNDYLPALIAVLGEPTKRAPTSITWSFVTDGFPTEVYLTDPTSPAMQEQLRVFELLRDNQALRQEYEQLKEAMNGRSIRDYQAAKYEFYNRILGL